MVHRKVRIQGRQNNTEIEVIPNIELNNYFYPMEGIEVISPKVLETKMKKVINQYEQNISRDNKMMKLQCTKHTHCQVAQADTQAKTPAKSVLFLQ